MQFHLHWQSTLRSSQSCGFSETLDPMVYLVRVEQAVAAERIQHIVHVTVVWSQVLLQAIPQVQVVESVKVHIVETVNVVLLDRERK